jgi:arginyl-tRNA synthetase
MSRSTSAPQRDAIIVERTRDAQHGDFATNIALRLAKSARRNPRELAQAIVAALPANPLVARTEVAGAGFINFFLTKQAYADEIARIHAEGARYGSQHARRRRARARGVRVRQSDRAAARRSWPPGRLRRDPRRTSWMRSGSAWSASITSMTPAGRWTSSPSASGCGISSCAPKSSRFRRTATAATTCRRSRALLLAQEGTRFQRPAAEIAARLPPDAPAGDKEKHIDALIERARELLGGDGFREVLKLVARGDAARHQERSCRVRRRVRSLDFGAGARRQRRHRAGPRAS